MTDEYEHQELLNVIEELPNEFEMLASFSTWLKAIPFLKSYERVEYNVKGHNIGYFKKINNGT